jgi:hypothetical protein
MGVEGGGREKVVIVDGGGEVEGVVVFFAQDTLGGQAEADVGGRGGRFVVENGGCGSRMR